MFQPHSFCSNNEIRMITVIGFQEGSQSMHTECTRLCRSERTKENNGKF